LISLERLLEEAGCREGEERDIAERELGDLQKAGVLTLEPVHKRDPSRIGQIRFSPGKEALLYERLGRLSPTKVRASLAEQFNGAGSADVPETWRPGWSAWCLRMREAALAGRSVLPFEREPTRQNAEILKVLEKLLAWQGESLVRFASCVLCGDSKRLEALSEMERDGQFSGKLRGTLGRLLSEITNGAVQTLDDIGIIANPRFALIHGPLRLRLESEWIDFGTLHGPFRLSQQDIARAAEFCTPARRCLTIENETSFHELAKLRSGELLLQTSYPGSGTLALLKRLPASMEFWHFGDSDPAGFEILRVLREKSGREFRPLHMKEGRVPSEQESLGTPDLKEWPFYSCDCE
jgi:hypothetical protein